MKNASLSCINVLALKSSGEDLLWRISTWGIWKIVIVFIWSGVFLRRWFRHSQEQSTVWKLIKQYVSPWLCSNQTFFNIKGTDQLNFNTKSSDAVHCAMSFRELSTFSVHIPKTLIFFLFLRRRSVVNMLSDLDHDHWFQEANNWQTRPFGHQYI